MFWQHHQSSPHIDVILSNKDVSVLEVLDEEDIIQECKVQNQKVIEYLLRQNVMEELVSLILDPPNNMDEKSQYKYPNIACELLTCDVRAINERIAGNEMLLEKLYSFLERDAPLNPLLASFFSKLLSMLIARKSERDWFSYQFTCLQVLEFLKSKDNCVELLLKHLGTSAIMDLMLKLITQIEGPEMKQNILTWLNGQNLVQKLVALLHPSVDSDRHGNASQLLCDAIKMLRENQTSTKDKISFDPILDELESADTVTQLLDNILGPEKCETAIVGGISVLLTLLDQGKDSPSNSTGNCVMNAAGDEGLCSDGERISKVIQSTTATIIPRLKDFHNLLVDPPYKPPVKTAAGVLDPPVGLTRLQVAKLLAALVGTNNIMVNKEIAELGTVEVLLDMFFKYTMNNFLHTQVEKCIAFALNSELTCTNSDDTQEYSLLSHIFVQCSLLQRILDAWDQNDTEQSKPRGVRCGYMGHLIKIANHIAHHAEKEPFTSLLKEYVSPDYLAAWETFVTNALAETNRKHLICMGGSHPAQASSDDNNLEYPDIPFPQGISFRQAYSDYEIPQNAAQFIENCSFQDDEFAAIDDANQFKDETDLQEDIFTHACSQNVKALAKNSKVVWNKQEQELNFQSVADSKTSTWQNEDESGGNSSDEDERGTIDGTEIVHMEIDSTDPWYVTYATGASDAITEDTMVFKDIAPVIDAGNPWESSKDSGSGIESTSCEQGWADFDSGGFADFDANFGPPEGHEGQNLQTGLQDPEFVGGTKNSSELISDAAETFAGTFDALEISKGNKQQNSPDGEACEASGSRLKSDDNANCNSPTESDSQLLIDNYRFLSAQGLIVDGAGNNSDSAVGGVNPTASNNSQSSRQSDHEETAVVPDTEPFAPKDGLSDIQSSVEQEAVTTLPLPKPSEQTPTEITITSNGPV